MGGGCPASATAYLSKIISQAEILHFNLLQNIKIQNTLARFTHKWSRLKSICFCNKKLIKTGKEIINHTQDTKTCLRIKNLVFSTGLALSHPDPSCTLHLQNLALGELQSELHLSKTWSLHNLSHQHTYIQDTCLQDSITLKLLN